MAERTISIGSAGKSLSMTGWKVGWASGPSDLIGALRVVRQHMSFVSGGPFQWAVAEGLALPDDHWTAFAADMQAKRDVLSAGLAGLGLDVVPSEGTYYVTTGIGSTGYADGLAFCRDLPTRAGVVAIPQQVFHDASANGAPYVRWAFCKRPEVLHEALDRLARALR